MIVLHWFYTNLLNIGQKQNKNISTCSKIFKRPQTCLQKRASHTDSKSNCPSGKHERGMGVTDVSQYRKWQGENTASRQNSGQLFSMTVMFFTQEPQERTQLLWPLISLKCFWWRFCYVQKTKPAIRKRYIYSDTLLEMMRKLHHQYIDHVGWYINGYKWLLSDNSNDWLINGRWKSCPDRRFVFLSNGRSNVVWALMTNDRAKIRF